MGIHYNVAVLQQRLGIITRFCDYVCVSSASPGVSRCSHLRVGHSIDLDHLAAYPIGTLLAYANLAEFQPRRGSREASFTS